MSVETFTATDVDHAIEMAQAFKSEGKYDWFRGQVKPWPPHSSAFRRVMNGDETWHPKLLRFFRWLDITPGLDSIRADRDAAFAVAQHYGIPTYYLDFTTDPGVAGYFACDTERPEIGSECCIYCLNSEDLRDLWNTLVQVTKDSEEKIPELDLVAVKVPNLWRLEAQKGTFLYCPTNWDFHYPMDRIVFPFSGYPVTPTSEDIYPARKSQLEILVDQYFMNEALLLGAKEMRKMYEELNNPNKAWLQQETPPPDRVHGKYFVGGKLARHASWEDANLDSWLSVQPEELKDVQGPSIRLAVRSASAPGVIQSGVRAGIKRILAEQGGVRRRNVTWVVRDPENPQQPFDESLIRAINRIWDGMRSLPFSDAQLADSIGACVALNLAGLRIQSSKAESLEIAKQVFGGETMTLEFGAFDGSYSQGLATIENIWGTVRDDIESLLLEEHREKFEKELRFLLQIVQSTRKAFMFDPLVKLFAQELIPTQVLMRERGAAFFSPARVDFIGLP